MLDYLDALGKDDWMARVLVCPRCFGNLSKREKMYCVKCDKDYKICDGIPVFDRPPQNKREYQFEMDRYRNIAIKPPKKYDGYQDSMPEARNDILVPYIRPAKGYLNIGQGFGLLEDRLPDLHKTCLDQCIEFLQYCKKKKTPHTRYVMGFGEQMPFKHNYFPAVVSDSVFQTVVDQKEFLVENARVLKKGGTFILTITYKWNYPRKPQQFPADNPALIISFLRELGIKARHDYIDLKTKSDVRQYEDGDFLLITGTKL